MSLTTTLTGGASSLYTTVTTCLDNEGQIIPERRNTAIGTTITTAACGTLQSCAEFQTINRARALVEALSDEELATLDQMLKEKEIEFMGEEYAVINTDSAKVNEKTI